jgi:hypothetical protein
MSGRELLLEVVGGALEPVANVMKHFFFFVADKWAILPRAAQGKPYQPDLIFAGKPRAYLNGAPLYGKLLTHKY